MSLAASSILQTGLANIDAEALYYFIAHHGIGLKWMLADVGDHFVGDFLMWALLLSGSMPCPHR